MHHGQEIKEVRQAQVSPLAQLILSIPEIKSVTMKPTSCVVMQKVAALCCADV